MTFAELQPDEKFLLEINGTVYIKCRPSPKGFNAYHREDGGKKYTKIEQDTTVFKKK